MQKSLVKMPTRLGANSERSNHLDGILLQQRETATSTTSLDSSSLACGTAQAVSDSWWSCSCSSHWARLSTTLSARDIVVSQAAAPRRHCVGAAKTERRPGSHRPHHLWLTSTTPSNVDPNERTSASTRSVFRVSTVRSTVESWLWSRSGSAPSQFSEPVL